MKLSLMMKKRIYMVTAILVALSIVVGTVVVSIIENRTTARAIFDPNSAVTYSVFKTRRDIDDSVLFIGTYILHKDALTDQLYEKAKNSASQSGQDEQYYKSELADGQWFNIGDVDNGLKGIASEGSPVSESRIDPLYVQYYCGSDGILIDALTNLPVNPFDVPDPYDLKSLEELQPLWMQYTSSQSTEEVSLDDFLDNRGSKDSGKLRTDVYLYQLLHTFFAIDLQDENSNLYGRQLSQLNGAYISLKEEGAEDEAAIAYELMEKIDAARRAEVFEKLAMLDINALNTLFDLASGSYYTSYGSFKDSSSADNIAEEPDYIVEIQDAVKHDASVSTGSAWLTAWLSRAGITTGSSPDWYATLEKEDAARKKRDNESKEDKDKEDKDDDDEDEDEELDLSYEYPFAADNAILDAIGTCISKCSESYATYSAKALRDEDTVLGHSEYVYGNQVIQDSSAAGLGGPITQFKHVRNIREATVTDAAGELDLIQSSLMGQASSYYATELMQGETSDYGDLVGEDARKSAVEEQKGRMEARRAELELLIDGVRLRDKPVNALEFTYERIDWAEAQYGIIPEDDFADAASSSLDAHITWLKELAQRIIDSDESLKSDLDKLRDKKEELQEKRDDALDDNDLSGAAAYDAKIEAVDRDIADEEDRLSGLMDDGTAGDQAAAQNAAGNSLDALTKQLVDKAVDKLSDDADADLSAVADSLAGLGAEDALKDLADKAAKSGASDKTVKALTDAAEKAADQGGDTKGISSEQLLYAIAGYFGTVDDLNGKQIAITTAALSQFARMGCENAKLLARQFNNRGVSIGSPYFYTQYANDRTREYVSLKTIGECTDFRYFYDDKKHVATMTKGGTVYILLRGSDQLYKGSTESDPETLSEKLVFSGVPYAAEADAAGYFGCRSEYVVNTSSAVCYTETMESIMNELLEIFAGLDS